MRDAQQAFGKGSTVGVQRDTRQDCTQQDSERNRGNAVRRQTRGTQSKTAHSRSMSTAEAMRFCDTHSASFNVNPIHPMPQPARADVLILELACIELTGSAFHGQLGVFVIIIIALLFLICEEPRRGQGERQLSLDGDEIYSFG